MQNLEIERNRTMDDTKDQGVMGRLQKGRKDDGVLDTEKNVINSLIKPRKDKEIEEGLHENKEHQKNVQSLDEHLPSQ